MAAHLHLVVSCENSLGKNHSQSSSGQVLVFVFITKSLRKPAVDEPAYEGPHVALVNIITSLLMAPSIVLAAPEIPAGTP